MSPELIPEDNSCCTAWLVTLSPTSCRLGSTYYAYAKTEIHLPGAGACLAAAEDITREAAEDKLLEVARRLIKKKT